MKSRLKWLVLVLCLVMGFSALAIACGDDDDKEVAVTSITLNETTLNLMPGETAQLEATVAPDNATNKEVTWTSSNVIVAEVTKKGKVIANIEGTVVITAKAGDKTATCTVEVKNMENPYWIAGNLGVAGQSKKVAMWDEPADLDTLGARRLTEGDDAGVYSTTLNLYTGDTFKIRTLGMGWTGQLNWDNATDQDEEVWGELGEDEKTVTGGNGIVFNTGDNSGEYGFKVTKDGEYTITLDATGSKPLISYEFNKEVDPLPVAANYAVNVFGVIGGENYWADGYLEEAIEISADADDKSCSFILELAADDEIQFRSEAAATSYGDYRLGEKFTAPEGLVEAAAEDSTNIVCETAGIYYAVVALTDEGEIDTITITAGIPLEINAWGDWKDGWSDGEVAHVKGTSLTALDTAVTMEMTVEFAAQREFGFQVRIEGQTSSEWAAGGQRAEGVDLPTGLTQDGNFTAAAGTAFKFTFSIKYVSETGKLAVVITAIEAVNA